MPQNLLVKVFDLSFPFIQTVLKRVCNIRIDDTRAIVCKSFIYKLKIFKPPIRFNSFIVVMFIHIRSCVCVWCIVLIPHCETANNAVASSLFLSLFVRNSKITFNTQQVLSQWITSTSMTTAATMTIAMNTERCDAMKMHQLYKYIW